MSLPAISQRCAQNALEELEKESKPARESQDIPFEYLRRNASTEEVKRQWFDVAHSTTDFLPALTVVEPIESTASGTKAWR